MLYLLCEVSMGKSPVGEPGLVPYCIKMHFPCTQSVPLMGCIQLLQTLCYPVMPLLHIAVSEAHGLRLMNDIQGARSEGTYLPTEYSLTPNQAIPRSRVPRNRSLRNAPSVSARTTTGTPRTIFRYPLNCQRQLPLDRAEA